MVVRMSVVSQQQMRVLLVRMQRRRRWRWLLRRWRGKGATDATAARKRRWRHCGSTTEPIERHCRGGRGRERGVDRRRGG